MFFLKIIGPPLTTFYSHAPDLKFLSGFPKTYVNDFSSIPIFHSVTLEYFTVFTIFFCRISTIHPLAYLSFPPPKPHEQNTQASLNVFFWSFLDLLWPLPTAKHRIYYFVSGFPKTYLNDFSTTTIFHRVPLLHIMFFAFWRCF